MRASGRSAEGAELAPVRLDRLLGVSAAGTDIRASSGRVDSRPVNTSGAALGNSKALVSFRMAGMTHTGTSAAADFFVLRGVLLPVSGVLGVVRADTEAAVALLLGVCGSRLASDAGSALLR